MTKFVSRFVKDESGATAIEYGLIAALIAVALVSALTGLKNQISNTFGKVGNSLAAA
jgi:pilus assembly protein Flp/PilA